MMSQHEEVSVEDRRETVKTVLEEVWTLFDEVQDFIIPNPKEADGAFQKKAKPDFLQRAEQLVIHTENSSTDPLVHATLPQIVRMVESCSLCPLSETRNHAVPGVGMANARLMVIGEGPGADEDASGEPFVGKAGKYLDSWLNAIHLNRAQDVFITNIVKCRPPQNRNPHPAEANACIPYLKRQISLVKPDVILCVGKVAANYLLQCDHALHTMRSTIYRHEGIPVVVTYHPAAVLRNLDLRKPVWEDLKRVAQLIDIPIATTKA